MSRKPLLLLAVLMPAPGVAQPAPQSAPPPAASFCGIDGADVGAIHAKVAADARFKRDGGDATREVWSAESIQAILSFTTAKAPAHPAAICQQVVDREGTLQIDREVRCQARAAACAALTAELDKADEGSGDEP